MVCVYNAKAHSKLTRSGVHCVLATFCRSGAYDAAKTISLLRSKPVIKAVEDEGAVTVNVIPTLTSFPGGALHRRP